MLKSELPHEAPSPVSKKASRVHHAARRCGGRVAARGARAAGGDEFLISLGRNDRANRTGIPARLERVINTPERNS